MIYIPIFVNTALLLLFDYMYLSFSLIRTWLSQSYKYFFSFATKIF